MDARGLWKQVKQAWHWLWNDDSLLSWVISVALAFVIIKFILYPGVGLILGTQFPVVAVVSDSMEHNEPFETWWGAQEDLYLRYNITRQEFRTYPLQDGFDKGDIILLVGVKAEKVERGDVIVFWGGKPYPIIHRVIGVYQEGNERYYATKGDNNLGQIMSPPLLDERRVPYTRPCGQAEDCQVVLGRAVLRIPYLGWVKIGFVNLLVWLGFPIA